MDAAVARLANTARRSGRTALVALGAVVRDDEQVEVVVQGRFDGTAGAAALTAGRVVVVNDRQWRPRVESIELSGDLTVQGWADDRTAALVFRTGVREVTIDHIADLTLAQELAHRARSTIAARG